MPNAAPDPARTARVDAERKHLEGLFKDRINIHLLFASVFMIGLSTLTNPRIKLWALALITVVSLLLAMAILRTYFLVKESLKEIKLDPAHPYTVYQARVPVRWDALNIMIVVPFVLTAFFLAITLYYTSVLHECPPPGQPDCSTAITAPTMHPAPGPR